MGLQPKEPDHLALEEEPAAFREDRALQEEEHGDPGAAEGPEAALARVRVMIVVLYHGGSREAEVDHLHGYVLDVLAEGSDGRVFRQLEAVEAGVALRVGVDCVVVH